MANLGIFLTPGVVIGSILRLAHEKEEWPLDVRKVPLPGWDGGVFNNELVNLCLTPAPFTDLTSEQRRRLKSNPGPYSLKLELKLLNLSMKERTEELNWH